MALYVGSGNVPGMEVTTENKTPMQKNLHNFHTGCTTLHTVRFWDSTRFSFFFFFFYIQKGSI